MAKNNKINPNTIIIIIGIVAILLVVSKLDLPGGFSIFPEDAPEGGCAISLNKLTFPARETITGTIQDGPFANCILYVRLTGAIWTTLGTFQLDSNGYYSHTEPVNTAGSYEVQAVCTDNEGISCKTDTVAFTVTPGATTPPPADDDGDGADTGGYSVGYVIDTFSGSGSLPAWTNDAEFIFDLSGVDVGENCRLGARIDTYWAYESSAACYLPGVGYEAVNWKFYDSTLVKVWDKTDYSSPSTNDVDLCPFVWDGFTPWKLEIKQTQNMQDCIIDYNYNVEIYVCGCD